MIHDFLFAFALYEGIKCFKDECFDHQSKA